jgi:hypothetical protein
MMAKNKSERGVNLPEVLEEIVERVLPVIPEAVELIVKSPDSIALDTFLKIKFGKLVDQAGGFAHYAGKQNLRRCPRAVWEAAFTTFMTRKVGA